MNTSGSTNKVAVAACPFCGGTDTACGIADEEFGRFWVECICGARGPTVETLKDARPAWNKRLAPEPDAKLNRAARRIADGAALMRDHLSSCDRTMGATHACTCGMWAYSKLLRELDQQPETKAGK